MEFSGKTALVTGCGAAIGKATALRFARNGANLVLIDMNPETLEATRAEAEALGAKATAFVCDISDEEKVNEVCAEAKKIYGKVDILVNNAGIWRTNYPFATSKSEDWKLKINVNILGAMYLTRALLPDMLEAKWGRVINVGSVAGKYGIANMVDYSMTKGALCSFSLALSKETTPYGVTVNCLSPGNVSNEGVQRPELSYAGRSGDPEEFASTICFLASKDAAYISGVEICVDGGRKKI